MPRTVTQGRRMQAEGLSFKGILVRLLGSLVLVYATFNPEGQSFYHWAIAPIGSDVAGAASAQLPIKLLVGLLLLAGWVVFVQTTRRSIGAKGAILVLAILATIIWALVDSNLLKPNSSRAIAHLALIGLALVLTLGMSWSHVSRKLTGQVDTDDID